MPSSPGYALSQLWPSLSGTTADKVAQVNAMTVSGPNVDVSIQQLVGYLLLQGIYPTVVQFSSGSTNGNPLHDGALLALKTFVAWLNIPNAPPVHFSDPTVFSQVSAMAQAVTAQETASPGSTGSSHNRSMTAFSHSGRPHSPGGRQTASARP